jgi:hypothetical protein
MFDPGAKLWYPAEIDSDSTTFAENQYNDSV